MHYNTTSYSTLYIQHCIQPRTSLRLYQWQTPINDSSPTYIVTTLTMADAYRWYFTAQPKTTQVPDLEFLSLKYNLKRTYAHQLDTRPVTLPICSSTQIYIYSQATASFIS